MNCQSLGSCTIRFSGQEVSATGEIKGVIVRDKHHPDTGSHHRVTIVMLIDLGRRLIVTPSEMQSPNFSESLIAT